MTLTKFAVEVTYDGLNGKNTCYLDSYGRVDCNLQIINSLDVAQKVASGYVEIEGLDARDEIKIFELKIDANLIKKVENSVKGS